jgi:probable blue pigment (indigoidine) exporter
MSSIASASSAALDAGGILAGLAGATSMALGSTLSRKCQPPVSPLTFTAWQLTAGGILLVPVVLVFDRSLPLPTISNLLGLVWLGLIGAALTYVLWFRGIGRLPPAAVSSLLFLSPLTAVLLGWVFLQQSLSILQMAGIALVIGSILLSQRANKGAASGGQDPLTHSPVAEPQASVIK